MPIKARVCLDPFARGWSGVPTLSLSLYLIYISFISQFHVCVCVCAYVCMYVCIVGMVVVISIKRLVWGGGRWLLL